jgi:hypothetical protein
METINEEKTTPRDNELSSLAVRSVKDELKAINAWVLDHLPCDDKEALLDRARYFRGMKMAFTTAASRAAELNALREPAILEEKWVQDEKTAS